MHPIRWPSLRLAAEKKEDGGGVNNIASRSNISDFRFL